VNTASDIKRCLIRSRRRFSSANTLLHGRHHNRSEHRTHLRHQLLHRPGNSKIIFVNCVRNQRRHRWTGDADSRTRHSEGEQHQHQASTRTNKSE
jgi:hypothetical protein